MRVQTLHCPTRFTHPYVYAKFACIYYISVRNSRAVTHAVAGEYLVVANVSSLILLTLDSGGPLAVVENGQLAEDLARREDAQELALAGNLHLAL